MSEEELIERLKELKEEGAILGEDEVKILLNLIENSISKDKISEIIEKERCETTSGYNDWKYDENVYEAELNMINIIKKAILKGE